MNFELNGYIIATAELTKLKDEIAKLIEKANSEFSKGMQPGQEGKVKNWSIDGTKLKLDIVSGGQPRPHEFLIRLRKLLAESLGKKCRVGFREVFANNYRVEFELEFEPKRPMKLPLVESYQIKGKSCTLVFVNLDEEALQRNYVDRLMKLVNEKARDQQYAGKEEFKQVVWEGKQRKVTYRGDPATDLEAKGWIRRAHSKAQWVYGPEWTILFNVFKGLFQKHVYDKLEFREMLFPKFEPWDVPAKSGHAANIYPNAYFVAVPKESSPEAWEEVMDHFKVTGKVDTEGVMKRSTSVGIMSYAQCPPFWPFLQGKTIDEESLPFKVFDWSGPTYRNESGGTHGLDRIEEFHRIETLWVGTKAQTIKIWNDVKDGMRKFFDSILDMEIRVAKVASWWMAHAGLASVESTADVATFDFEAYLPYRGERSEEWLEIQNASSNGTKYPQAFAVKGRKEEIWSGCGGGSFERFMVAFLAQKGLDPKNWPDEVRKPFMREVKKTKPLKFL